MVRLAETRTPPMTLESAAVAHLRIMVWRKVCGHRGEPDPAEQARWGMGQRRQCLSWRRRLVCSQCASRNVDMVVTGTRR
jgi:hypothetical protein